MNIKQSKKIPIVDIVDKLGGKLIKDKGNDRLLYTSPLRNENDGSFYVYTDNNLWHDFGHTGKNGGDGLDLVTEYLKENGASHSVSDALAFLDDFEPLKIEERPKISTSANKNSNEIVIDQVRDSLSPSSLHYLKDVRGIDNIGLIRSNLKQVHFHFAKTPHKKLYAVGFENQKGGFELRGQIGSHKMKYAAGVKDITLVKGKQSNKSIDVYEGFPDYITNLQRNNKSLPDNDSLILNAASMQNYGIEKIKESDYEEINLFKQNDSTGEKVYANFKEAFKDTDIVINDKSSLYKGYEDFNDMHIASQKKTIAKLI